MASISIEEMLENNSAWENPYDGGNEPCEDCSYMLEHVIFGQKQS